MIPALVQWELTEKCPYRCQHCYLLGDCPTKNGDLSDDAMFRIAEILAKHRLFFVTFTGGEPLVRRHLVIDLAKYLNRQGMILSLNTCLILLDEATLADLPVHHYLISCPSSNPDLYRLITGTGDYRRFEARLKLVLEARINHTVNMVVSKMNRGDIRNTAEHLAALGVKRFAVTPVSFNARSPRFDLTLNLSEARQALNDLIWAHEQLGLEVDVMEALPKCALPPRAIELKLPFIYRRCMAGKRNGTISPRGEIRPCGHNPRVYGNILEEDLARIWLKLHNWRDESANPFKSCLTCDWFNSCHGGCQINVDALNGHADIIKEYVQPMPEVKLNQPEPVISSTMLIRPCRCFQARPEGDGWLISSGNSRNIIHINRNLYQFLVASRDLTALSMGALAVLNGTRYEDLEFQRVMKQLLAKQFFVPVCSTTGQYGRTNRDKNGRRMMSCSAASLMLEDVGMRPNIDAP